MLEYMTLGEICTNIIDCPHETPKWQSNGVAVIRNFNLVNGTIDMQNGYYVDEETYIKRTRRAIPSEGDIIFSREAPIGNCAIIPANFKCCLGQRLVLLKVDHAICSSEYLLAVLQSPYVKWQIEQVSKRGSIVSNYAISDLRDLKIPILSNQDSVAGLSSAFSGKIANNESICSDLESMTKLLYDYWFVQFDFPDEKGKPYKSSGGKMVWNEELKKEIPEGWKVKMIRDIASLHQESVFPQDGVKYNHYSIPAFDNDKLPAYEDGKEIASNKYLVPNNCVLVSKLNPQFKRIWLPSNPTENSICSTEYLPLVAEKVGVNYLYEVLNSDAYSVHLRLNASSSTGSRKRIDPENCMAFQLAFDEEVAIIYENSISDAIQLANYTLIKNRQLSSLRDFLLPMLMNGQVTVEKAINGDSHAS